MDKALIILEAFKLIERVEDGPVPLYFPVALSPVPLFLGWESWLAKFCTKRYQDRGDESLLATYVTISGVILVALLSGSREVKLIVGYTRLPRLFVELVMKMLVTAEKWYSVHLFELQRLLVEERDDHDHIGKCIDELMDWVWAHSWTPEREIRLNRLRAGRRIGRHTEAFADYAECVRDLMCSYQVRRT